MRIRVEVPLFCEELSLRPGARYSLVLATAVSAAFGIGLGAWGATRLSWLSGVCLLLATAGFFCLWRLARFETNVGRFGVRAGCWQLFWSFPRQAVQNASVGKAQSWRKAFATQEVTLCLQEPKGQRFVTIPSRDPQELLAALREHL